MDLNNVTSTALQTGLLLIITALLGGVFVTWLYGRWAAVRHAWPLVLILGLIQGGGQTLLTLVETGGWLVSDEIRINTKLQAVPSAEDAEETAEAETRRSA